MKTHSDQKSIDIKIGSIVSYKIALKEKLLEMIFALETWYDTHGTFRMVQVISHDDKLLIMSLDNIEVISAYR